MTHYENAIKEKATTELAIKNISLAANLNNDPKNDKHDLHLDAGINRYGKPEFTESWAEAKLYLHMSYGWYGNSSGYSVTDNDASLWILRAFNAMSHEIAERAVAMAKEHIQQVCTEAKLEAEKVLAEVST